MGASNSTNLNVQTIFTPPATCAQLAITQIANDGGNLWKDIIQPAANVTVTSCYPDQFVQSAVATASLPPFQQIICPVYWNNFKINSTYIICCPPGFGLFAPNASNTARPATGAICTSSIWPNVLYDVTSWDTSSVATVIGTAAGANGTLVYATPFDGTIATTTLNATSSSSSMSMTGSASASKTTTVVSATTTTSQTTSTAKATR